MLFRRRKKAKELRSQYRVAPGEEPMSVQIRPPSGPRVTGELIDISGGGVAVGFAVGVDPNLIMGERSQLAVSAASHGAVLIADATLAGRTVVEKQLVRYGYEFADPHGLLMAASPAIAGLLNRRSDLRVRPPIGTHLVATLHLGPSQSFEIQLRDLSPNGLGFILNELQSGMLSGKNAFEVELRVPRTQITLRWRAVMLHSTQLPRGGTLFGLVFDQGQTATYERERAALFKYCTSRAVDMARWVSE